MGKQSLFIFAWGPIYKGDTFFRQFVDVMSVDLRHKQLVASGSVTHGFQRQGMSLESRVSALTQADTSLPLVVIPAELLGPMLAFGSCAF